MQSGLLLQEDKLLPHIARDAGYHEQLRSFLMGMTDVQYGFSQWEDAPQASTGKSG